MADIARVVNTTIRDYIKGYENQVMRDRRVLDLMRKRGRIIFNCSGDDFDWKVRYKRAPMFGYADGDTLTFSKKDKYKTATLPYRGYSITDAMGKMERLKNRGAPQIVNVWQDITTSMLEDLEDQWGDEFYIDGNGSSNSKRYHGLESFFGNSGAAANGYIANPSDSYAGLNTDLGNYSGSWSTVSGNVNWPAGTGDAHYDFWSPLIVDYTDTAWSASTKTWPNTCVEALRFGVNYSKKNKSKRGELDLILLNRELYRQFQAAYDSKERIVVDKSSGKGDTSVGFGDSIWFDGVEVTSEYGVPSSVGYGMNVDQMELRCMEDRIFVPEGPDYDISTKTWRFSIDVFSNLKFNPRYFVKFQNVT